MAVTNLKGETWLINETITVEPYAYSTLINFVSNNQNYGVFYIDPDGDDIPKLVYADKVVASDVWDVVYNYGWANQAYRIITFEEAPTGDLLTWLQANAVKQGSTGYEVTFVTNGGTSVTKLEDVEELPTPLPTTTKANHVFAGWYYDNLFTQKANAGDELTTSVTLYAKWYTPTSWCEDIADAIREKEGSFDLIKHIDFPDRINKLNTYESVASVEVLMLLEPIEGRLVYVYEEDDSILDAPSNVVQDEDVLIIG